MQWTQNTKPRARACSWEKPPHLHSGVCQLHSHPIWFTPCMRSRAIHQRSRPPGADAPWLQSTHADHDTGSAVGERGGTPYQFPGPVNSPLERLRAERLHAYACSHLANESDSSFYTPASRSSHRVACEGRGVLAPPTAHRRVSGHRRPRRLAPFHVCGDTPRDLICRSITLCQVGTSRPPGTPYSPETRTMGSRWVYIGHCAHVHHCCCVQPATSRPPC
jgi:hypothetical protein